MTELNQVYNMLEDEESRDIFINRINYWITGKEKYLQYIIDKYVPDVGKEKGLLHQNIEERYGDKDVIIWGCGHYVETNIGCWEQIKNLKCFCDCNIEKQQKGYLGYAVISPEELFTTYADAVVVIGTSNYFEEIKLDLLQHGIRKENIVNLGYYVSMSSGRQYFDEKFIPYIEDEVFVDAGAYDLFSTKKIQNVLKGKLKKAYAFEPDKKNYLNCLKIKEEEQLSYIEVLPYGTWDSSTVLKFSESGTADSDISDSGNCEIETKAIDEVVEGNVTFIKMDVEGAELKSLQGAKNTIVRYRPKLAICIYHKPEDMAEIPLYIKSLVPDYKLYIRHYSNNECETVLYAI